VGSKCLTKQTLPPATKIPKRFRLGNLAGVTTELRRAYRAAWLGEIDFRALGPITRCLRELRTQIEFEELGTRMARLEAEVKAYSDAGMWADARGAQPSNGAHDHRPDRRPGAGP
jgi:hypothetical protein